MSITRRLITVAAGALLLLPGNAQAHDPVIVDESGDLVPPLVCLSGAIDTCSSTDPLPGQINPLLGPAPEEKAEPSIDIVEGNLTTSANDLVVSLRLLDVDAPGTFGEERTSRLYEFYGKANGLDVVVSLHRQAGKPDMAKLVVSDGRSYPFPTRALVADVDVTTDTVTWQVPLPVLADAAAEACPACAPVGRGTVLSGIKAGAVAYTNTVLVTEMSYSRDLAAANRDYTIGER